MTSIKESISESFSKLLNATSPADKIFMPLFDTYATDSRDRREDLLNYKTESGYTSESFKNFCL